MKIGKASSLPFLLSSSGRSRCSTGVHYRSLVILVDGGGRAAGEEHAEGLAAAEVDDRAGVGLYLRHSLSTLRTAKQNA
ncbi:unnamed protein product [Linum trigynum]|uniref:Uncharacterized protein n=1 Tax=Linum trigynum TaxID=586398 RepID=A0AAV2E1N5_9ROSI